jgi:hypothetical protein
MDARAAPFISVWLVVGTIGFWGTRPDWPVAWNALGVLATLAWMAICWTAIQRLRGRPVGQRPTTFDLVDIATIGLLPSLPAGLIDGSGAEAISAALGALAGVGAIYVVIGFGLAELTVWAVERLWVQVSHLVELVARTLPLLLILVVFLLFAAEIWEAAHAISALELAAILLLLLVVATMLVVTAFRRELRLLEARNDFDAVVADAAGTPAGPLAAETDSSAVPAPRLTWLQRANLTLLIAFQQLLQAAFVAVVVMAFLVVFALIAIPASVQEAWIGEPVHSVARFDVLGELRTLSQEMLTVCALLGGIVGLYFSGLAITDRTYRAEQFDEAVAEVRQLLAVRALYLPAVRNTVDGPIAEAAIDQARAPGAIVR